MFTVLTDPFLVRCIHRREHVLEYFISDYGLYAWDCFFSALRIVHSVFEYFLGVQCAICRTTDLSVKQFPKEQRASFPDFRSTGFLLRKDS